ncbi:MAG: hypothetical protein RJA36_2855 [Pseudomonadota bacterium]
MNIVEVRPENWSLAKPFCEAWERSRHGCHTVNEIIANCIAGEWQLWLVADDKPVAVYATRVFQRPRARILEMPMLIGSRAREWWRLADEHVNGIAKAYGCTRIQLTGRAGWQRLTRGRYAVEGVLIGRKVD